MIKKVFTLEKGKVVACKTDEDEAPLRGSLSYVQALPSTSQLKAALQKARLGDSVLAIDSGSGEVRATWRNSSSRFIKTKNGKSAVVMGGKIILEQG